MPVTANADLPFDHEYLARQTMGDKELEREILALFVVQCENCALSLDLRPDNACVYEIAHRMKGCALSVGAGEIAGIAADLENNPQDEDTIVQLCDLCRSAKKNIELRR